jgi:hypothetical protein
VTEELERTVLHEIVELHPERLTIPELILRIARNPADYATAERIRIAARDLRRSGLARYRDGDEIVEPTHAALRAFVLFTE